MLSNHKKHWFKVNSVLLIFAVLFTSVVPSFAPSEVKAAEKTSIVQPQPVELPWYRNETTKVFGNPDGTLTAEVSSEPIHFLKDNSGSILITPYKKQLTKMR
ncbi:MAG: hypothetical protein AB7E31_11835 [Desulfitobacterium sp.]